MTSPLQKTMIGSGQLFCTLFVSRAVFIITMNADRLGGDNLMDNIVSAWAIFLVNYLIVIPIWILYRRHPTLNILDLSYVRLGKPAIVVTLLYILYFLFVDIYYLSFFQVFATNVMDPQMPTWLVGVTVLAVACYGAWRGIEAISRAAVFVFAAVCLGMVFVIFSMLGSIDPLNYKPLFYEGGSQTVQGMMLFLSGNTGFVTLLLLLPLVRGRKKLGFTIWNFGVYSLITLLILVMVGTLGAFLETQLFPVYTLTSIAEFGALRRLDAVFTAIWMVGLFVKLTLDIFLISMCVTKFAGSKIGKGSIFVSAALVAILSFWVSNNVDSQQFLYSEFPLLLLTLTCAVLVPVFLLIIDTVKRRKGEQHEN